MSFIWLCFTFAGPPACPSHVPPSDRALISATFSQQSRLRRATKKVFNFSSRNLRRHKGPPQRGLRANFSRVSSDWFRAARVPPPPSNAYWPPDSHVRFFSDNTRRTGWSPHPDRLSHRLSQLLDQEAAAAQRWHTRHTWATLGSASGSLTTLNTLCQLLKTLTWSRGFQFLLMPVANFSMAVSVNCVRRLSLGVPERTPASSRRPEFPGCGFHHHHHHHHSNYVCPSWIL